METSTFLIKFIYKDQVMKELEIPSETLNMAVKIAIDSVGGYITWDKIKVESK
jgi:hypothetical protein